MNNQTPVHFAISPADYAEYLELKDKNNIIDYNRLKTGSKVMLKETGFICNHDPVDFNSEFEVVLFKSNYFITGSGKFSDNGKHYEYCTFYQDGKFVLYSSDLGIDYITKVIEY